MNSQDNIAGAIIEAAREGTELRDLSSEVADAVFGILVPGNQSTAAKYEVVDLEAKLIVPRRASGRVLFDEPGSLIDYVNRHKTEATTLVGNRDDNAIVAVLNDHAGQPEGVPGWRDHVARLDLRVASDWEDWYGKDRTAMNQVTFAELIEDHLPNIQEPDGATMLELAQTFEVTQTVSFRSQRMLGNGQEQLTYVQDQTEQAGAGGDITVPRSFTLGVQVYEGMPTYKVTARLRNKLREGKLTITYLIDRPEDVLAQAFDDVRGLIHDGVSLPVWSGQVR